MTTPTSTVLIAGYYGFQNLGDEMILEALLVGLKQAAPDHAPVVVSGDPDDTRQRHGVEAVSWTDLEAITQAIAESRLVVLGGGGLFHDRHDFALDTTHLLTPHHAGLTYYADICLIAHILGVPYVLPGVGVGPLQSEAARQLTAWCFQHAAASTVRDQESLGQLRALSNLSKASVENIRVAADLALLHPAWGQEADRPISKHESSRLAVIPRPWTDDQGDRSWEGELARALAGLEVDEIIFLPFQSLAGQDAVDDLAVCRRIMAHPDLSGRNLRLEDSPLKVETLEEVLSSCQAVIAMRYHGALAGLLTGRPVLALAYDPKVAALMQQVGQGEWILQPEQWIQDSLLAKAASLLEQGPAQESNRVVKPIERAEISLVQIQEILRSQPVNDRSNVFMVRALFEGRAAQDAMRNKLIFQQKEMDRFYEELSGLRQKISNYEGEIAGLEAELSRSQKKTFDLSQELFGIHTSRYWKALGWYWRLRHYAGKMLRRLRLAGRSLVRKPIASVSSGSTPRWEDWGLPPAKPSKADIILFPIIDWNYRFQRPQQLARQMAQAGHRIFYLGATFNPGGLRHQEIAPNTYQLQLPGSRAASIYRQTASREEIARWTAAMAEAAHAAGIAEAVCLVQLPYWGPLAAELSRAHGWKLVYDCMDDHAGFSTNAAPMLDLEEELLIHADLVLATSEKLYQRSRSFNENVQRLPNAADLEHFSPASGVLPAPDDFPAVDGPVIGYIGAISDWFDFDLLRHAVEALPRATFYLIGNTWGSDPHTDLAARPNVHFVGEKAYQSLPGYLSQFDVCLIPFKDTPLTRSTDPVKLYEYLAAGKPVVARGLPELEKFSPLIHLADTPEAFTQAIEDALEQAESGQAQALQQAVRKHGWGDRAVKLLEWVEALFESVSLVIPVWNQLEQSQACLASLLESTRNPQLEIIVVDNGSDMETAEFLDQWSSMDSRCRVVHLPENVGFAPAVNLGLQEARGEILGILNNDITLTRGWLSKLVGHLKRDSSIGMIGPLTNEVGNEARLRFESSDRDALEVFSSRVGFQHAGRSAPIPMLAMFCVLLPRSIYHKVGGLDERFSVGMFEDDDYALRLRQAGYRPACARDVFIHHTGQASFEQLGAPRYRAIFQNNQGIFESKWDIAWPGHSHEGLDEYESAFAQMVGKLPSDAGPLVVLPIERRRFDDGWQEALASLALQEAPRVYWGRRGSVEFEHGGERFSNLPWVALDAAASPLLLGREPSPPQEIWLRLRNPHYAFPD